MFTREQYREKAAEYEGLLETAIGANEKNEYRALKKRFSAIADDMQRLTNDGGDKHRSLNDSIAETEEYVLQCLGAALIMRWHTLPTKLRKEIFEDAGAIGELLESTMLRSQIARFLHKYKESERAA